MDNSADLEQMVGSSKESLKTSTDEVFQEKLIYLGGAAGDGKPLFETIGAWKMRQEKEV
jgi:hypothetical protein